MTFEIGDKVIYPNHGLGIVERIEEKTILGTTCGFYHLRIVANETMVLVPIANVDGVGLRRAISDMEVERLFGLLGDGKIDNHQNWKGRFKDNSDKMRSGSIYDVADVLKSLTFLAKSKSLSFREKRMLDRLRVEALGPKGALKVALDDEAFDPAGYLSASARTIAMEPDGRFSLPAEFAGVLEVGDGVMLVGKGDKFQLWNPARWQARRDSDRDKMAAFVRGLGGRRRMNAARHVPVLAREVVDALQPRDGGRYLDGTFGAGGYRRRCSIGADCQVIAIDRDPDAIAAGKALAER